MTEQQAQQLPGRGDGHLTVYLGWPLLAGLGLGVVLGASLGGILMVAGTSLVIAMQAAGVTFFAVWGLSTLAVFVYAASTWAGPRRIAEIQQDIEYLEPAPMPEPQPRFISVGGRLPTTRPVPQLPSGANDGGLRTKILAALGMGRSVAPTTIVVNHDAPTLEPDAPNWVREFYTVLTTMWNKPLTRRTFETQFPTGGQGLYSKYVGKTPPCMRKDRGIWQTWGIITQTGSRGSWEFCQPLDVIFKLDSELNVYANAMTALAPSPNVGLDMDRGTGGYPNQTKPVIQTTNQKGGGQ